MKSTLIRILSIMTLATSISAFGLSEKAPTSKKTHSNKATTTARYTQDERKADQNQKEKSREQKIEEQNEQWLHDLQGVYGG